jgi:hypothetical protein
MQASATDRASRRFCSIPATFGVDPDGPVGAGEPDGASMDGNPADAPHAGVEPGKAPPGVFPCSAPPIPPGEFRVRRASLRSAVLGGRGCRTRSAVESVARCLSPASTRTRTAGNRGVFSPRATSQVKLSAGCARGKGSQRLTDL